MTKRILQIFILFFSLFLTVQISFAAGETVAKVVFVKGTFTAGTRNLSKNSLIYQNDSLKTGPSTLAEIVFTDNTLMTFKENTNYSVSGYTFSPNTNDGSFVGKLTTGGFRTVTGLIGKNHPQNYAINTPVATIGVRGTDYQAVMHNGSLYIVDYSGVPCVTNLCTNGSGPAAVETNSFVNWVSNPAVYMPQVLAIPDGRINSCGTGGPVFIGPAILGSLTGALTVNVSPFFTGTNLVFTFTTNVPVGGGDTLTLDATTGLLVFAGAGPYTVTVFATNGCGTAMSNSFVVGATILKK